MVPTIHVLLELLSIICFVLAALGVSAPRGNLVAAGLALWELAALVV